MIKLENISSGYNKIEIIKNINIDFEEGSITTIIGKNGCGKTTLLRTASNLLRPFHGKITIDDKDIAGFADKELAKKISFLPQLRSVPNITVYNLVMHGRYPYLGFPTHRNKIKKLLMAIEDMGMERYIKNIQELSDTASKGLYRNGFSPEYISF